MDTNLVQSLINIMECQLEEAFEAAAAAATGGRKMSASKRKGSVGGEGRDRGGVPMDAKVRRRVC